jgi:hypothetical protein
VVSEQGVKEFAHSPFRKLTSLGGDEVYANRHYTDDSKFVCVELEYNGEDEDGDPIFVEVEISRTLADLAAELSFATGDVYLVAEHTFSHDCKKCTDLHIGAKGFKGS